MKNRTLFVMILLMFSLVTFGQKEDHRMKTGSESPEKSDAGTMLNEITLGYGAATFSLMESAWLDASIIIGHEIFHRDSIKYSSEHTTGTISVGYNRCINKVVAIGAALHYEGINQTTEFDKGSSYRSAYRIITLMPSIYFHYIRRPIFTVYSGFSVGASLWLYQYDFSPNNSFNTNGNKFTFALQLTGIGVRVGKDVAGFLELGAGNAGVIRGGLSVKFNGSKK